MKIKTLTIVGVGLIGGSIGLATRQRGLAERIVGVGRKSASLDRARDIGAIDEGILDLEEGVHQADVAVFCTPVNQIAEQILKVAPGCRPGALLTDAGSTKAAIVAEVESRLPAGIAFAGSHPLAGSEKRGPEHADPRLFQDRLTVVTRTERSEPVSLQRTMAFWQALGSRVRIMTPEEHDRAVAFTSHLPHLLAVALAGVLPPEYCDLTATGFRDTTRVAAGDPEIWSAIFAQNRAAVLDAVARLHGRLEDLRQALAAEDHLTLDALLRQAKRVRDALGN
jgi:prephenate dehydrogenase